MPAASAKSIGITLAYALAGWALCGLVMFAAMAVTTLPHALIGHALAAPVIFAAVSFIYFRRPGSWSPLTAAAAFVGVVMAMDLLVVALLIEKSFDMFKSLGGTWLPFLLIFVSTWMTGLALKR
ncbi:MAG: hypothetical protein P8Z30_05560 [Acidobacteriota bacterium]